MMNVIKCKNCKKYLPRNKTISNCSNDRYCLDCYIDQFPSVPMYQTPIIIKSFSS